MKLNNVFAERSIESQTPSKKPSVVISANPKRTRILLDADGNEISNFKSKQIIRSVNED